MPQDTLVDTSSRDSGFARTFALALALGAVAAAVLAPVVAYLLALSGFHIPFPRIFDRVVMITVAGALILFARRLRLVQLLREGFRAPLASLSSLIGGLGAALIVIVVLCVIAIGFTHQAPSLAALVVRAFGYLPAALLIGVIEEAFFRVILLGGLARDFRRGAALVTSSAVYAAAHLVRGPKHYYLSGFHPAAGFSNLLASLMQLAFPSDLIAMTFGLLLLGLVLGEAFLATGRVYLPIGLHAGFVIGAKCWPLVAGSVALPRWLAGPGPVPLIAAPAAWAASLALLALMPRFLRGEDQRTPRDYSS